MKDSTSERSERGVENASERSERGVENASERSERGVENANDEKTAAGEIDLEPWEPQPPPIDFADRVMTAIATEKNPLPGKRPTVLRRRAAWGGAVVTTFALAAAVLLGIASPPFEGSAIAKERVEVALGRRGVAVLEPGASVEWRGDEVMQSRGDVFYRVEPGSRFRVHTPAGDVEVEGTCFAVKVRAPKASEEGSDMMKRDVRSGVVGGALTALAFVAVYEGKVAVSHAAERAELAAGESAAMGPKGVAKGSGLAAGEKAFEANAAEAQGSTDPLMTANQRLAHQVGEYRSRLESVTDEKAELERKLKRSEQSLAATQDGSTAVRDSYDLTTDDWKQLAADGAMKYQFPCVSSQPWSPSANTLNTLGLSPQDGDTIKSAYARSSQRIWDVVKPLCIQVVGSAEVADKIGADYCMHLVLDSSGSRDAEGKNDQRAQAATAVAEMRAGLRPLPGANDAVDPVTRVFLLATDASKSFEDDLAQSFGPDEAHRLVFSHELCMNASSYRSRPSKPKGDKATDALDDVTR